MVSIARKNLFQEKTRLIISAGGVAFSVLLILTILGLYQFWGKKITAFIDNVQTDLWVSQKGSADMFHSISLMPTAKAFDLKKIEGVADVDRFLGKRLAYERKDKEIFTFVVGYDPEREVIRPVKIEEGAARPKKGEIIIDRVFAKNNDYKIGDTISIYNQDFKISSIASGGNLVLFQYSFINFDEAEELYQMKDLANYFLVRVKEGADLDSIKREIEKDSNLQAVSSLDFAKKNRAIIEEGFLPIIWVLVIIGFVIGVAVIGLTIYTATVEKTREYGVLKALGASNLKLYKIIFEQSLISGLIGYVIGLGLTFLSAEIIERFVPAFAVLLRGREILLVFGAAILMSVFASYVPIRKIVKIDPAIVFKA